MKRRLLCLLPIACLMLSACGGSEAANEADNGAQAENSTQQSGPAEVLSDGDVNLTIWGPEEDAELLATIVENFKAKYGAEANFTFEIGAMAESDCKDAILMDVNNAPDVFTFADDQLSTLAAGGVLKPISYEADNVKARNLEGAVAAASVGETMYAYPLTADNGYFLYYNKAYLSESDVATMDGLLAAASASGKKVTMDWGSGWYIYSLYGNTGLTVGLNDDGISNYCDWNSTEGAIKGTDVAEAMMAIGSNSGFLNGNDDALLGGAKNDSVIAGVSGVWLSNSLSEIWGSNLGAVKLPTYTVAGQQIQMSSYAGYKLVGVNSYSKNTYWAEVFAEFMTNEDNQSLRFEVRGQGPSNAVAAGSDAVAASPAIQALIQQSEFASLQRIGAAYWGPAGELGSAMAGAGTGGLKLQEFLDNIVADITASNS